MFRTWHEKLDHIDKLITDGFKHLGVDVSLPQQNKVDEPKTDNEKISEEYHREYPQRPRCFFTQVYFASNKISENKANEEKYILWIKDLISNGADVKALNQQGKTVLEMALSSKALVEVLLDAGVDMDARDHNQYTALLTAVDQMVCATTPDASEAYFKTVKYLVERKACLQIRGRLLSDAYQQIFTWHHDDDAQASQEVRNRFGKVIKFLRQKESREHAIFAAIGEGRPLPKESLETVNLNCRDEFGYTPLLSAAYHKNLSAVIALISLPEGRQLLEAKRGEYTVAFDHLNTAMKEEVIFKFPEFEPKSSAIYSYQEKNGQLREAMEVLPIADLESQVRDGIEDYLTLHATLPESQSFFSSITTRAWQAWHQNGKERADRLTRWMDEAKGDPEKIRRALKLSFYDAGNSKLREFVAEPRLARLAREGENVAQASLPPNAIPLRSLGRGS